MSYYQHPVVKVFEVGSFQGSYQAYCPECLIASGEAVTADRALANFQESACSCYDESLC
ncbi:MAG: hypothetical protein H0W36_15215 [Gemmatimonadetes bacterium]|jgi:hypothetical protein|nr:hypothetical protein [Gemmatimonadota bacterium]